MSLKDQLEDLSPEDQQRALRMLDIYGNIFLIEEVSRDGTKTRRLLDSKDVTLISVESRNTYLVRGTPHPNDWERIDMGDLDPSMLRNEITGESWSDSVQHIEAIKAEVEATGEGVVVATQLPGLCTRCGLNHSRKGSALCGPCWNGTPNVDDIIHAAVDVPDPGVRAARRARIAENKAKYPGPPPITPEAIAEAVQEMDEALEAACDCGGLAIFDSGDMAELPEHWVHVEKCDECDVFESDGDAALDISQEAAWWCVECEVIVEKDYLDEHCADHPKFKKLKGHRLRAIVLITHAQDYGLEVETDGGDQHKEPESGTDGGVPG